MQGVSVRDEVLVLRPGFQLHRIDLNFDLVGTDAANDAADRRVEVLGADEAEVQLDGLGEDRVPSEENGGGAVVASVAVDLEVGEAENARQEERLGGVDAKQDAGNFLEVRRELVRDFAGEIGVGVVDEELQHMLRQL